MFLSNFHDNIIKPSFVFDGRNILGRQKLEKIGFKFYGIGKE